MKKKIYALLLAAVMAFGVSACGTSDTENNGTQAVEHSAVLNMGTGDTTGSYYAFGNLLAAHMGDAAGVTVDVVSTDGSAENIKGIESGLYQLGMAQADVMSYAWDGILSFAKDGEMKSFRAIGGLYEEALQIVTLDENIKSVGDLRGKTVSIGAESSGVAFNAMNVLDVYDLRTGEDIQTVHLSFADSVAAMKEGKVDAVFIVSGAPTNVVEDLIATENVHLVNIDAEKVAKLQQQYPYYNEYVILSGTYTGLDQDVTTVSIQATMIVSADMSEEDVYNLTAGIYDNVESVSAILPRAIDMNVENGTTGISVPFHKGAAKYYAEHGFTVPVE
ncbi:MAG: TAXI family TRAP transporter solute-binding subunit [Anaerotignum sp.]|nr:TAXI family TRAP transporter solute-binding subunit [Anaerotignum sp.]